MSDAIGETTPLISSAGMSTRAVPSYSSAPSAGGAGASSSGLSSDQEKDGRFTCNICLDSVTDPVTTLCGHLFCWPCLYRWLETHHTTCPVCLAGVSRENVIPLFIKGSEDDPRTKAPASDVPSRPNAQRPEAPARTSANGAGNAAPHFGGMSFTAGFGFFPSLFGLQFQSFVDPVQEEEQEAISRMLIGLCVIVVIFLFAF